MITITALAASAMLAAVQLPGGHIQNMDCARAGTGSTCQVTIASRPEVTGSLDSVHTIGTATCSARVHVWKRDQQRVAYVGRVLCLA